LYIDTIIQIWLENLYTASVFLIVKTNVMSFGLVSNFKYIYDHTIWLNKFRQNEHWRFTNFYRSTMNTCTAVYKQDLMAFIIYWARSTKIWKKLGTYAFYIHAVILWVLIFIVHDIFVEETIHCSEVVFFITLDVHFFQDILMCPLFRGSTATGTWWFAIYLHNISLTKVDIWCICKYKEIISGGHW